MRTSRSILRGLVTAVGVALALVIGARDAQAQVACYTCVPCTLPSGHEGHGFDWSPAVGPGLTNPDPLGECHHLTCDYLLVNGGHGHTLCTGTFAALTQIRKARVAVERGDDAALASLVAASRGVLVVNRQRSALQAVGCDGAVVAHIALAPRVVARLSEPTAPAAVGAVATLESDEVR